MGKQVSPRWQPIHWPAVADAIAEPGIGHTAVLAVVPVVEPVVVLS